MIKKFKKLTNVGIEGLYLNIIKTFYGKSTTSIILNREKLKVFPLKSVTEIELPPLLFNRVLQVLATVIMQEIRISKLEGSGETVMICRGHDTISIYRKP